MTRNKQRALMGLVYESEGWSKMEPDLLLIGIDVPGKPDFLFERLNSEGVMENLIVDIADYDVDVDGEENTVDDKTKRFVLLKDAIKDRPDVHWEIRFFDISKELRTLTKFVNKIRDDVSGTAGEMVLDEMKRLGLANKHHADGLF